MLYKLTKIKELFFYLFSLILTLIKILIISALCVKSMWVAIENLENEFLISTGNKA